MDRRSFLVKGSSFLFGSFFGWNCFSNAFAFGDRKESVASRPRISLIIDDIGQSISHARRFFELDCPITFSILPRLVHSHDLALEIHERGYETMLHQPMEPCNPDICPGPGALYVGDEKGRIEEIMQENISSMPFARGVNNHMGSRFTACEREIGEALTEVHKRGLFFIDSLTSSRSVAYEMAKRLHIHTACRNVFLDNVPSDSYIKRQLLKLSRCARQYGHAVGIGHPFRQTAESIRDYLNTAEHSRMDFVFVSGILKS